MRAGCRFVAAEEAPVYEIVPPEPLDETVLSQALTGQRLQRAQKQYRRNTQLVTVTNPPKIIDRCGGLCISCTFLCMSGQPRARELPRKRMPPFKPIACPDGRPATQEARFLDAGHMYTTNTVSSKRKLVPKLDLSKFRNSSFVKNVLVVMSGSAIGQIIGFALIPIISRLFSPSDYGVSGAFGSVSVIISAGVTLDYSQAIMLPKAREDAINIFFVSCLSTFAIGFLCFVLCLFASSSVNGLIKTSGAWAPALLVVAVVVSGINSSCQAWCVRSKAFKHTSASQVVRSLLSSASQVGLGYLKGGAAGLIVSGVLADMMASVNLFRVVLPDILSLRRSIRLDRIKQLAKEYRDFPMYSASQNVINALSSGVTVLLLTHFYGIVIAGAYAFGVRLLYTPMGFVTGAVRQVLFQKASETIHQGGNLTGLYIKSTTGLFALAFVPSLVLFIWAPQIFSFIFGAKWHMAGEFARFLVLWSIIVFCNVPAVLFGRLVRIQRTVFIYDLVLLVARVSALLLGGLYLSALHTITAYALVGGGMNVILILLVGYLIMKKERHVNLKRVRDCLVGR